MVKIRLWGKTQDLFALIERARMLMPEVLIINYHNEKSNSIYQYIYIDLELNG